MRQNRRRFVVLVAIASALALSGLGVARYALATDTDDQALQMLKEGCHNADTSVASGVGTVVATLRLTRPDGGVTETESTYDVKFKKDRFRFDKQIKYVINDPMPGDKKTDPLVKPGTIVDTSASYDGQVVTVLKSGKAIIGSSSSGDTYNEYCHYKLFAGVHGHGVSRLIPYAPEGEATFDEVHIVGHETVGSCPCTVVEVVVTTHPVADAAISQTIHYWVCPDKGFTILKTRRWAEGTGYKEKMLIAETEAEVREYPNGVWGPARFTSRMYGTPGNVTSLAVVTYADDFRLNAPVSDADLVLKLPRGTKVHNELLGEDYTQE